MYLASNSQRLSEKMLFLFPVLQGSTKVRWKNTAFLTAYFLIKISAKNY